MYRYIAILFIVPIGRAHSAAAPAGQVGHSTTWLGGVQMTVEGIVGRLQVKEHLSHL